ncbi:MAG: NADH-quinone oxidoreductase subunit H [Elusimicrobia bacterium]|nr:NADH-quinone oxidoreductase subunit H [Elusimicrobiota bacterium]
MSVPSLVHMAIAMITAPLIFGIINRTKSLFGGREGPPLLQQYFDIAKLLQKGTVYSRTTSWVFRAGPVIGLACVLIALALLPLGPLPALCSFPGDFIVMIGLLAVMRFFTMLAAIDAGSSFEGMGASREATFSALAEPALFLCFAAISQKAASLSLSDMFLRHSGDATHGSAPAPALLAVALFVVFLAENARIPVDDPNTHLELTMIHEVMALDYGGPDLAFIFYASALKLWILGALVVNVVLSGIESAWAVLAGLFFLAIIVGAVESTMARLKLLRVPQLLIGAGALAMLTLIVAMG